MIFDFNKQFKSKMIVRDRAFGGGKNVTGLFSSGEYEKIEMENTEFNRMYKVSATDEHDAFYILTPHMMENMMELNRKINGELVLGFFNGKLHVAVHNNENSFEPHLFSTTDYGEMVRDVKGEIDMIVKFVEEMNLDRDIWEI